MSRLRMRRDISILLASFLLAVLLLITVQRPLAWGLAAASLLVGLAIPLALVFDVNSSYFARTLWRAPRRTDGVALTFDDGPDPAFTLRVLSILEEKRVPAAFFVVGARARAHPEVIARMHRAGHLVGNHSDRHAHSFHFLSRHALRRELAGCDAAIQAAIGCTPALFRSPQGFKTPLLGLVLGESSMTAVGWQVRGLDGISRDAGAVVRRVVKRVEPGGVILLHDGAGLGGTTDCHATLAALPVIIDRLREQGLRFVRLDELLEVEAYRPVAASSRA